MLVPEITGSKQLAAIRAWVTPSPPKILPHYHHQAKVTLQIEHQWPEAVNTIQLTENALAVIPFKVLRIDLQYG